MLVAVIQAYFCPGAATEEGECGVIPGVMKNNFSFSLLAATILAGIFLALVHAAPAVMNLSQVAQAR